MKSHQNRRQEVESDRYDASSCTNRFESKMLAKQQHCHQTIWVYILQRRQEEELNKVEAPGYGYAI